MDWNKIKRRTPLLSYLNYALHEVRETDKDKPILIKTAKALGHFAYMAIGVGIPMWYVIGFVGTGGELNPIKQQQIVHQMNEKAVEEQKQYKKLWQDIFGYGGYADLNANGVINFDEKVDAFRRMSLVGEYDIPIEGETQLPKPTLNDLEKAVQDYQAERK